MSRAEFAELVRRRAQIGQPRAIDGPMIPGLYRFTGQFRPRDGPLVSPEGAPDEAVRRVLPGRDRIRPAIGYLSYDCYLTPRSH